jgi:8-oxo-dGTP pyrophosphatase MutT (NUDIX family)
MRPVAQSAGKSLNYKAKNAQRLCPHGARSPLPMKALWNDPLAALRAALPQAPQEAIGRDEFAPYPEMRGPGQGAPVAASVLIPVVARAEPMILFTRRTQHLARHSGQISFPGGRREDSDMSPVETALRETQEETGIAPSFISIAGFLPRYLTGTGFDISPVVGVLSEGFSLAPDVREVAEIFEVPLAFFLEPGNVREVERSMAGRTRLVKVFEPQGHDQGHYIWGITAALLLDLAARLRSARAIETP